MNIMSMCLFRRLGSLPYHFFKGLHFVLKDTCLIGGSRYSACRLAGGLFWFVLVDFLLEALEPFLWVIALEGLGVHLWLYDLWSLWGGGLVSALAAASLLLPLCALFVVGEGGRALAIGRASVVIEPSHPWGFCVWVVNWRLLVWMFLIILIGIVAELIGIM